MKLSERIKSLFRRRPLTEDERAARGEAESIRQQALQEQAGHAPIHEANLPPF